MSFISWKKHFRFTRGTGEHRGDFHQSLVILAASVVDYVETPYRSWSPTD